MSDHNDMIRLWAQWILGAALVCALVVGLLALAVAAL